MDCRVKPDNDSVGGVLDRVEHDDKAEITTQIFDLLVMTLMRKDLLVMTMEE